MGFSEAQSRELRAKLRAAHVKARKEDGRTLSYIEGWHAIAEANRIFGFDGWDRETIQAQPVWSELKRAPYRCVYVAKVRITVRAGEHCVAREGSGSGEGSGSTPGEAHDAALKAAETDATKRALMTFGNPFGLALYDREHSEVTKRRKHPGPEPERPRLQLKTDAGDPGTVYGKAEEFGEALDAAMDKIATVKELFALWERNLPAVRQISRMPSPRAELAEKLVERFKAHAVALADANRAQESGPGNDASAAIDKSQLAISEPKRIRSREHLAFVASQPCLICGRKPAQAHHVRYAQPRAMARKVSDEFAVPLCSIHHDELHRRGNERNWWLSHNCDPLTVAAELWRQRTATAEANGTTASAQEASTRDLPNRPDRIHS